MIAYFDKLYNMNMNDKNDENMKNLMKYGKLS